jgi:hypothetical protein
MTVIAVSPAMPAAEPPYLHLVAGIRVRLRDCGQWLLASTLDRNEVPVCGLFLAPLSKTRFRRV